MTLFQAIILSIVQGITEFLPISSSGHLILFPKLFGWKDQGLAFDAIVHLGTSLAVILYFYKDIKDIVIDFFTKRKELSVVWALLISMIPAILGGFFLKDFISMEGRSFRVVLFSLIVWGLILILAEYYSQKSTKKKVAFKEMTAKHGILIGLAQALALIPGTSRSGITLAAGYFLDIDRKDAVKFSFLMGLPVILGAGLLSFLDLQQSGEVIYYAPIITALLGSFVSGLFAIHLLEKVIEKRGLYYFGVYRIVLALSVFWIF